MKERGIPTNELSAVEQNWLALQTLIGESGESERGALWGLLHGVKPAVLYPTPLLQPEQLASFFHQRGRAVFVSNRLIVDLRLVQERLRQESYLANTIGWKTNTDPAFNISRIPIPPQTPEQHAQLGFLLGFPASAITDDYRVWQLAANGVPNHFGLLRQLALAPLQASDAKLVTQLGDALAVLAQTTTQTEFTAALNDYIAKHTADFAHLYQTYFPQTTAADLQLLLSKQLLQIQNKNGDVVYEFSTYGAEGDTAPDVAALVEQVQLVA